MSNKYIKFIVLILISVDLFANNIATLTALKGDVGVERAKENLEAILGMKLLQKDYVLTKENSKAQLMFHDKTVVSIGKNTNFSIEEYLYDETNEPVAKFNILHGAMRTITGKIGDVAPHKFSVSTKTATIGIRGTNFTVVANMDGSVEAYCTYGTITSTINSEVYDVKQGFFIIISPSGPVEIKEFSVDSLREMRKENFDIVYDEITDKLKDEYKRVYARTDDNDKNMELIFDDRSSALNQRMQEMSSNSLLNQNYTKTLDSVIAGHSMRKAVYYGSYDTINNSSSLQNSGDSKLNINFSNDTALLEIGAFTNKSPDLSYSISNVVSSEIDGVLSDTGGDGLSPGESGAANGTFFGLEGNTVRGEFNYSNGTQSSNGVYSLHTFQDIN